MSVVEQEAIVALARRMRAAGIAPAEFGFSDFPGVAPIAEYRRWQEDMVATLRFYQARLPGDVPSPTTPPTTTMTMTTPMSTTTASFPVELATMQPGDFIDVDEGAGVDDDYVADSRYNDGDNIDHDPDGHVDDHKETAYGDGDGDDKTTIRNGSDNDDGDDKDHVADGDDDDDNDHAVDDHKDTADVDERAKKKLRANRNCVQTSMLLTLATPSVEQQGTSLASAQGPARFLADMVCSFCGESCSFQSSSGEWLCNLPNCVYEP